MLRICWRGSIDRLLKEAELCFALPTAVPCPELLDYGRDEHLSWTLARQVDGETLDDLWRTAPEHVSRSCVDQLVEILKALHTWTPDSEISRLVRAGEPSDADDAVGIAGKSIAPFDLSHQLSVLEYALSMPFVEGTLLERVRERLVTLWTRGRRAADAHRRVQSARS